MNRSISSAKKEKRVGRRRRGLREQSQNGEREVVMSARESGVRKKTSLDLTRNPLRRSIFQGRNERTSSSRGGQNVQSGDEHVGDGERGANVALTQNAEPGKIEPEGRKDYGPLRPP